MTGRTRRLSIVPEPGRIELRGRRVLGVAEHEHDLARLARGELEADVMRAHRLPAVGDRVRRLPPLDGDRPIPAAVRPEERVALGVEAGQRLGAGEVREVVAPLPVLGLVVDDPVDHLDLADVSSCAGSWSRRPGRPTGRTRSS